MIDRTMAWILLFSAVVCAAEGGPTESGDAGGLGEAEMLARLYQEDEVDLAVKKALEWFRGVQAPDGSWTATPAGMGGTESEDEAQRTGVTALVVMAHLARGEMPGRGPYGEALERGIAYVLANQNDHGLIGTRAGRRDSMYVHGISTLMLGEVYGMSRNPVRDVLDRAVRLTLESQNVEEKQQSPYRGGWRYLPDSTDSDMSLTGWQTASLRSAKGCEMDVPQDAIDRAVDYIRRMHGDKGFGYEKAGDSVSHATQGIGLLSLAVCGEYDDPRIRRAGDWLRRNPLEWHDKFFFYAAYYDTQGMFQLGGDYWAFWQPHIERTLVEQQRADGSWLAHQNQEESVGPIYCTAMAVLTLSVEYQYLPIYQR